MDIDVNNNIKFYISGSVSESTDIIINSLPTASMFSGSIEYSAEEDCKSTYIFHFVNSETIMYILNELKDELSEVKVEIQTHDENAKRLQQEGIG